MVTIIERQDSSSDQFEFREASRPDEQPGWTVYAVITRQRVEVVSVSKSHLVPGGNYTTSATDQESHVVSDAVYLMRRRIDKRLEEVCQEVAFLKDRLTETVDGRNMDRISFKEKLAEAEKNLEVTKNNAVILLTQNEVLVKKQKDFDQMKEELAKVREYIGKERYDAIVATARLEKMAGSQA